MFSVYYEKNRTSGLLVELERGLPILKRGKLSYQLDPVVEVAPYYDGRVLREDLFSFLKLPDPVVIDPRAYME